MPTKQRVRGAIVEVSERISDLGYETHELVGPVNSEGEEISADEVDEVSDEVRYYLTGSANGANFYILFSPSREYTTIVYPMNVLGYLGRQLDEDEVNSIIDEDIEWEELNSQSEDQARNSAAERIIDNTDPGHFHRAAFNLSTYASTSLVDYQQITTENGFPAEFQCVRGMFPYSEQISMARLEDRIYPVVIAGERGRRYAEYSFRIDKEDKIPQEYEFRSLL